MKGFKYQITITALLYKHKMDEDTEYSPVYFNSATKTVINSEYYLDLCAIKQKVKKKIFL